MKITIICLSMLLIASCEQKKQIGKSDNLSKEDSVNMQYAYHIGENYAISYLKYLEIQNDKREISADMLRHGIDSFFIADQKGGGLEFLTSNPK